MAKFKGIIANELFAEIAKLELLERKYKGMQDYSLCLEKLKQLKEICTEFKNNLDNLYLQEQLNIKRTRN
ncbi:MAG: hypothetical protein KKE17_15760 [Proteobacteria bacterium]|nr:hypothetical protein [Pseudomonadota bacterium]MBU1901895.1 hypothetical protein [Patescibacteria group bacterium]